jgi:hypothetical protein
MFRARSKTSQILKSGWYNNYQFSGGKDAAECRFDRMSHKRQQN